LKVYCKRRGEKKGRGRDTLQKRSCPLRNPTKKEKGGKISSTSFFKTQEKKGEKKSISGKGVLSNYTQPTERATSLSNKRMGKRGEGVKRRGVYAAEEKRVIILAKGKRKRET